MYIYIYYYGLNVYVPGVSITPEKWCHYPKLRGQLPKILGSWTHFLRVMETPGTCFPCLGQTSGRRNVGTRRRLTLCASSGALWWAFCCSTQARVFFSGRCTFLAFVVLNPWFWGQFWTISGGVSQKLGWCPFNLPLGGDFDTGRIVGPVVD